MKGFRCRRLPSLTATPAHSAPTPVSRLYRTIVLHRPAMGKIERRAFIVRAPHPLNARKEAVRRVARALRLSPADLECHLAVEITSSCAHDRASRAHNRAPRPMGAR